MKKQAFFDWSCLNFGIVISWRTGIFLGFGPLLVRWLWGPAYFRCDECGRTQEEER
jgi:hypothetical protein